MADFPHSYKTISSANHTGDLETQVLGHTLSISPPAQFGGEGLNLSPEDLFSASISSCFILTLRALSRAKKMSWNHVHVQVDAFLDKKQKGLAFYEADLHVKLEIDAGKNIEEYLKLLHDSEKNCLIVKSLQTKINLHPKVKVKLS